MDGQAWSPRRTIRSVRRAISIALILLFAAIPAGAIAGPIADRIGQWSSYRQAQRMPAMSGLIRASGGQPSHASLLQNLRHRLQANPSSAPKPFRMKTTPMNLDTGTSRR